MPCERSLARSYVSRDHAAAECTKFQTAELQNKLFLFAFVIVINVRLGQKKDTYCIYICAYVILLYLCLSADSDELPNTFGAIIQKSVINPGGDERQSAQVTAGERR